MSKKSTFKPYFYEGGVATNPQKVFALMLKKAQPRDKIAPGTFKGVLHPRPVFGLFLQFSQKLQHIDNK